MNSKIKTIAKIWCLIFGVSIVSILAYQLIPRFGEFLGDLRINCSNLSLPIISCSILSAVITGVWAYKNNMF